MKLRGSLLVIVCCLVIELVNISQKRYMIFNLPLLRITGLTAQGLLFLLYPLLGHLTDVYLTRYRSLKFSYDLIIFGVMIIYIVIDIALWNNNEVHNRAIELNLSTGTTGHKMLGVFYSFTSDFASNYRAEHSIVYLINYCCHSSTDQILYRRSGRTRRNVLVSSTSSLVNGPPYLFFPRSIRHGISSSQ